MKRSPTATNVIDDSKPHDELQRALSDAVAFLDGAPPQVGPASAESFREWIESAAQAENWPDPALPIPNSYWKATKEHVTRLISSFRERSSGKGDSASVHDRLCDALARLLSFGALYSLNYLQPVERDGAARRERYEMDGERKAQALRAAVQGWSLSDDHSTQVPGMVQLILGDSGYAPAGLVSLKQFFTQIDYYFDSQQRGAAAPRPAHLCRLVGEPSVLAEDIWVKFMIRYHRREATIRETFIPLLRRRSASAPRDRGGRKAFWALQGVSLTAHPGEVIGIVGRNGSGKTTLLKTLAGILGADRGRVVVRGRVGCLLSFGVGFNANLSGRENVYLNGSILGLTERDIDERLARIVEFSELGEFIHAPVRTYSTGMRGRLGFSIAIHIDPDVLILDEVLSVGDAYFRAKAGSIVDRFQSENKTVIIASHSMDLIRKSCTRAVWLDAGEIRMAGSTTDVTRAYVADCREKRSDGAPTNMQSPDDGC